MPLKLVELLRDLHEGTVCALKGDHKSPESWFKVKTGFKQGDVNAPMLFNSFWTRLTDPFFWYSGDQVFALNTDMTALRQPAQRVQE